MSRSTSQMLETEAGTPLSDALEPFVAQVRDEPELVANDRFVREAIQAAGSVYATPERLLAATLRHLLAETAQKDELREKLDKLLGIKVQFVWVCSQPFEINGDGCRYVYGRPYGQPSSLKPFALPDGWGDDSEGDSSFEGRQAPYLAYGMPDKQVLLSIPAEAPSIPLPAEIVSVVTAPHIEDDASDAPVEVEVAEATDGAANRAGYTGYTSPALAREIRHRMEEDGDRLLVRCVDRMVLNIQRAESDGFREDWLEPVPLEGPSVFDLVLPQHIHRGFERDVRNILRGRGVMVICLGPTGTGKTEAARRVGRDAWRRSLESPDGRRFKGCYLVWVTPQHMGSSFIHQFARNLLAARDKALSLIRKGYVVVMLVDEADALFGETASGLEHSHNREERLAAQSLFSQRIEGLAVYFTMNCRRASHLPAAITSRFVKRVYPRPTRGQLREVARRYVSQDPSCLEQVGKGCDEFSQALADAICSDARVVARVHMHSGREIPVRARDLLACSPRKVKDLIENWREDAEDGPAPSFDDLIETLDRELVAPELRPENIYELTYLEPCADDSVRTVEIVA